MSERHGGAIPANSSQDGVTFATYASPELNVRDSSTMIYLDHLATQGSLHDDWNEAASYRARGTRGASRTSDPGKQFLAFIAAAPTDYHAMLGEIERLRAEVARLEATRVQWLTREHKWQKDASGAWCADSRMAQGPGGRYTVRCSTLIENRQPVSCIGHWRSMTPSQRTFLDAQLALAMWRAARYAEAQVAHWLTEGRATREELIICGVARSWRTRAINERNASIDEL